MMHGSKVIRSKFTINFSGNVFGFLLMMTVISPNPTPQIAETLRFKPGTFSKSLRLRVTNVALAEKFILHK
jgi:hypothetical protein